MIDYFFVLIKRSRLLLPFALTGLIFLGSPGGAIAQTKSNVYCTPLLLDGATRSAGAYFGHSTQGSFLLEVQLLGFGPLLMFRQLNGDSKFYSAQKIESDCSSISMELIEVKKKWEDQSFGFVVSNLNGGIKIKLNSLNNMGEFPNHDWEGAFSLGDGFDNSAPVTMHRSMNYEVIHKSKNPDVDRVRLMMINEMCEFINGKNIKSKYVEDCKKALGGFI